MEKFIKTLKIIYLNLDNLEMSFENSDAFVQFGNVMIDTYGTWNGLLLF